MFGSYFGAKVQGWPIDLGTNSLSEPATADDNDGDLKLLVKMVKFLFFIMTNF